MFTLPKKELGPAPKLALDIGPLVLFFLVNAYCGIFAATATFMVATVFSVAFGFLVTRQLATMPFVTLVVVLVFGSLTLLFHDDEFIKLKPTVIYGLFGITLLCGLAMGKPLLGLLLNRMFDITDLGWRKLTRRWAIFFLVLAVSNEIIWRNFSTDVWLGFKLFGIVPLTLLFGALQYPLIVKHRRGAETHS
ncbi:MAG: septation protein A [Pseudolabrys sp.]|nr:septation protein A [Pseudolabrys sp.]